MLQRGRAAQLLALLIIVVPVSLAEAKTPSTPQARTPGAAATVARTPTTTPITAAAPPPPPATASAAPPPLPAPAPAIVTTPRQVLAGATAVLEIQNPPAGATDYRWDLDGSGSFATDSGSLARVAHVYAAPGLQHVTVRITTATGTRTATLDVRVAAGAGSASQPTHAAPRSAPAGAGLLAHVSSDPADTISDFQFAPATITIHVGDTITWTNDGPTDHTATASDHSFDTGVLHKGHSASHTFATAGTFAYICTLHPFMHGTVIVEAAASSTTAGGSSTTTPSSTTNSTPTTPAATTPSAGQLPLTGFDVLPRLLVGVLLLAAGVTLRRVASRC
jgi:plastocyanin